MTNPVIEKTGSSTRLKFFGWWMPVFFCLWLLSYNIFAPHPAALFESNWSFILVGIGAAVVGNVSAIGGGIIFIPVMIFFYHLDPVVALKVSIATQCFGMSSGAIGWLKSKKVPLKLLWLTVPGLLIGSTIGSLVFHLSGVLVKTVFGPVSAILGALTWKFARSTGKSGENVEIPKGPWSRISVFFTSGVGGMVTSWIAIGEGELVADLLMLRYGIGAASAIGLGVLLLAINSIFLLGIHTFALGGVPWDIAAFTVLGAVFGARLGPFIGQCFNEVLLKRIFAAIAMIDGTLFIFQVYVMPWLHNLLAHH